MMVMRKLGPPLHLHPLHLYLLLLLVLECLGLFLTQLALVTTIVILDALRMIHLTSHQESVLVLLGSQLGKSLVLEDGPLDDLQDLVLVEDARAQLGLDEALYLWRAQDGLGRAGLCFAGASVYLFVALSEPRLPGSIAG